MSNTTSTGPKHVINLYIQLPEFNFYYAPGSAPSTVPTQNNNVLRTQNNNNNSANDAQQGSKCNRCARPTRPPTADSQGNENSQVTRRVTRQQTRAALRARAEELESPASPTPSDEETSPPAAAAKTTTTTTTKLIHIPEPAQERLRQNIILHNILNGKMPNGSFSLMAKNTKVADHGGNLRAYSVFFTFNFCNLLDKRFMRVLREHIISASGEPMTDIVKRIDCAEGTYYIAERQQPTNYKFKWMKLLQTVKSIKKVMTCLNICIVNNRYLLTHVLREPQRSNTNNVPAFLSNFRTFTGKICLKTATPEQIRRHQANQLLFYQLQQQFRDRFEQEQFRNRFDAAHRSSVAVLPGSEMPDVPIQRNSGMTQEQANAHFRTFMEMNASTACLVDLFDEKEMNIKMSNHSVDTMSEAYAKLSQDTEFNRSQHYGHSLVRPALKIVPYVDGGMETNYARCFIVINPEVVTTEQLLLMHGGDLSANTIVTGRNIPGCAIEDLHCYLRRRGSLTTEEALNLFYQMCETVRVCHRNGIILRDLKLKRFYFIDEERKRIQYESLEGAMILPDPKNDVLHDKIGCPLYTAPELLIPDPTYHGKPADMWSLGIILYTMLVGQYPFFERKRCSLINVIRTCKPHMPNTWDIHLRYLMTSLLDKVYTRRITIEQIFCMPWMKSVEPDCMIIPKGDLKEKFPISDNENEDEKDENEDEDEEENEEEDEDEEEENEVPAAKKARTS